MSLLKNLKTDENIANERDSVGGGGPLDSNVYLMTVDLAYLVTAGSGAMGLAVTLKAEGGRQVRETLWLTSGTEKGCKNYYEKDGEKHYLPGFVMANALALLTTGKELSDLDTETKLVAVYNREAKAEVPTKVEVPVELIGKEVLVGLIKQKVDKTVKTDAGYVPNGETREENTIDKIFRARDRMTTAEIRAGAEEAAFIETWTKKWLGQVRDRSKGAAAAGTAGAPQRPASGGGTAKPAKSLFA